MDLFGKWSKEELKETKITLSQRDAEIAELKRQLSVSEHKKRVLQAVLDLLPDTGTFLIDDIRQWTIKFSNTTWKWLVKKATRKDIVDWKTTIHEFHKTPERSKTVLWKMNTWEVNQNTTLTIGQTTIKSTSHKFTVDGKDYFLWLFSDWTHERKEIESIDFLRTNIEQLLQVFLSYSNLWVNFKILVRDLEEAKSWVEENKWTIDNMLTHIRERFDKTNALFEEITSANKNVATIFQWLSLLSLNGSIEAARQGENGRWFAVVANETRKTSEESAKLMGSSIKLVDQGIVESKAESSKINREILDILENDTIEKLVEKRVEQSERNLNELIEWLWSLLQLGRNMSSNFKTFYNEKLNWTERIKRLILTTKIDHLLFIIKLNTFLTTETWDISFVDHTSCDLWKTIFLPEVAEHFKEDEEYKILLSAHEQVHTMVKNIVSKLTLKDSNWKRAKGISKELLEEINTEVKWDLLSAVNTTLFFIDAVAKKL